MYIWQSTFPEIKMPAAIEAIIWISYGKDGCGYPYILWLLYSGNFIQQNKTKGRSVNDSKDLCIYVDDCNGTAAFILKAVIYDGVPIIYKRVKINLIKKNTKM